MLIEETIAITAVFQALVAKLYKLRLQNMSFIMYNRALINENKWRASRYGLDGKLIDFGKQEEVDTRELILELLDFVDDVVDELGSRYAVNYVRNILARPLHSRGGLTAGVIWEALSSSTCGTGTAKLRLCSVPNTIRKSTSLQRICAASMSFR